MTTYRGAEQMKLKIFLMTVTIFLAGLSVGLFISSQIVRPM